MDEPKMEKIVVIGSNSFSGSAFIKGALDEGFNVIGISRSEEASSMFLPYRWSNDKKTHNYRFYQYDLNGHLTEIMDLIRKEKPELKKTGQKCMELVKIKKPENGAFNKLNKGRFTNQ